MRDTTINLSHGGGGKAMRALIDEVFARAFGSDATEDQARLPLAEFARHGDRLAFTTDSYVVDPLFFRGSDIGALAVKKGCRWRRCTASPKACGAWRIGPA
jgi:hydrogenase expression/formation protein HypE